MWHKERKNKRIDRVYQKICSLLEERRYLWIERRRKRRISLELTEIVGSDNSRDGQLDNLLTIAKTYQEKREYLEASWCLERILKRDPHHIEALVEYALLAYDHSYWKESIKRYRRVQRVLDTMPSSSKREREWLLAQKKILISLLNQKKYSLVDKERKLIFQKLHGHKDMKTILKSWGYREETEYCTTFFTKGLSAYYTALHQLEEEDFSFIEKCCKKGSQEIEVYKRIKGEGVSSKSSLVRVPDFLGLLEGPYYDKLFLESIKERPIREISYRRIDFYGLGRALGELSFGLTADIQKENQPFYPIRDYHGEKALEVFSSYDEREVHHSVDLLYDFYSKFDQVLSLWERIPKVFSHNDTGTNNVFFDTKTGRFIFIDWERAAYNAAGSDIGSILRWKPFKEAERKGLAQEIESEMVDGYLSFFTERAPQYNITREEVILAYHFHFINGKLKTAINRGHYPLFRRIAERSRRLLEFLGL